MFYCLFGLFFLTPLFTCTSSMPDGELLELDLKEKNIGGFVRQLNIRYTAIDPEALEKGYRFHFKAKSYGWVLEKQMELENSSVSGLQHLFSLLLEAGLADLPPLQVERADGGVERQLRVLIRDDGKDYEFYLRAFGNEDRYDFDKEPDTWRSWVTRAKEGQLTGDFVPMWVYDRIFHLVLNDAFLLLPIKSMEDFCRQGG